MLRIGTATQHEAADRIRELYETLPFPTGGNHGDYPARVLVPALRSTSPRLILGLGCGTGNIAVDVAKQMPDSRVVGIDFSEPSIRRARARAEQHGCSNVEFRVGDLLDPIEGIDTADAVLCIGVLHHLPEPEQGARRIRELLRPGGNAIVWLYHPFGRRWVKDIKEMMSVVGGHDKDWQGQIELARKMNRLYWGDPSPNTWRSRAKKAVNVARDVAALGPGKAWRQYRTKRRARIDGIPEDINIADQLCCPWEYHFTVDEAISMFERAGLEFLRIVDWSMQPPTPIRGLEEFGELDSIARARIESAIRRPDGVGYLIRKPL